MGKDPDSIREEIVATRERMAGTAEALVERADVPANVKRTVEERRDAAITKVDDVLVGLGERVPGPLQDGSTPAEAPAHRAAARRRGTVIVVAGGALVLTAAIGTLVVARTAARRPPARVASAARGLPGTLRDPVLPAARTVDRWLASAAHAGRRRRDEVVQTLSHEIGKAVVAEQRRQNPFPRRLARDMVTAAATTTATLTARHLVRSALGSGSTAQ